MFLEFVNFLHCLNFDHPILSTVWPCFVKYYPEKNIFILHLTFFLIFSWYYVHCGHHDKLYNNLCQWPRWGCQSTLQNSRPLLQVTTRIKVEDIKVLSKWFLKRKWSNLILKCRMTAKTSIKNRNLFKWLCTFSGPKTCGCQFKSSNASFRLVFCCNEKFQHLLAFFLIKIFINDHFRGWFIIDLVAAIPFDLLLFGSDTDEVLQALTNTLIHFKVCKRWVPFKIPINVVVWYWKLSPHLQLWMFLFWWNYDL